MEEVIHQEIMSLEPSTLVVLYEINLDKKIDGGRYYFHAGENGYGNSIIYQGNEYFYHPISTEGFDFVEKQLPRPSITADNTDSFFSLKTRFFDDFVGYEVSRIRTFVRFLAPENFPNNINPFGAGNEESFPTEQYVVNKKTVENNKIVKFELASPLEKEGGEIPSRKIVCHTCQWRYRSVEGCGFTDTNNSPIVADSKNNIISHTISGIRVNDSVLNNLSIENETDDAWTGVNRLPLSRNLQDRGEYDEDIQYVTGDFVSVLPEDPNMNQTQYYVCTDIASGISPSKSSKVWIQESCSKTIDGCRLRFGEFENVNGLPFGGFPGAWT